MPSKEKKFLGKHAPLEESTAKKAKGKARTVEDVMREQEKARKKYRLDMAQVEKSLTEYLQTSEPVLWEGKPILWVRRPSMREIKALTPTKKQMEYMENPQNMPDALQKEYDDRFYAKFSELVVAPKKTADEWREIMNPWLLRLFWGYIAKIGNLLGAEIEGF